MRERLLKNLIDMLMMMPDEGQAPEEKQPDAALEILSVDKPNAHGLEKLEDCEPKHASEHEEHEDEDEEYF